MIWGLSPEFVIVNGVVALVLLIDTLLTPVIEGVVPASVIAFTPVIVVLFDAFVIALPESCRVPDDLIAPVVVTVVPLIAPPDKAPEPALTEPPEIAPDAVIVVALIG